MTRPEAASPIEFDPHGPPRSRLYDDLYFSRDDGLAEARAVFLAGCDLPRAWQDRDTFAIAELGLGTGLNVAAALALWSQTRPPGAHLSLFSIEAHPIPAADAARALAAWPELASISGLLVERWPGRARGFHRLDLPELNATLDVAILEAAEALAAWSGPADAWFLDGFAPAVNPDMWRARVLELVARRSAPGARLASYTTAGHVRRGLAGVGFAVERRPGFGRKRERLEARWPGERLPAPAAPRVAIIGGGIAGAALARAFRAFGAQPQVLDPDGVGAGASRGPAALVSPRLDAGLGPHAALFAQAFARATALYGQVRDAVIARGAVQLQIGPKDGARFAALADSDLFEPSALAALDSAATSAALGEPAPPGLGITGALAIDSPAVLAAWLAVVRPARVTGLRREAGRWRLMEGESVLCEADIVCVAAGLAARALVPRLPLAAVRGQASIARDVASFAPALFGGYVIPTREGLLFGATHDRSDEDEEPREADHRRNLDALAAVLPGLAARLVGVALSARTGIRATTTDYLPIAGPAPDGGDGLFVLTGLGSRGFTLAPLLAEHVAAQALGRPSPLPAALAELVDPARFERRARRRGRPPPTTA